MLEPTRTRPVLARAWWDYAACARESVVLFFGPTGELPTERAEREKRAKSLCRRCPARDQCLDFALSRGEFYGIWGGFNPVERRNLVRRLRSAIPNPRDPAATDSVPAREPNTPERD